MTDFYARLEGQLAEAAQRRAGAGRRPGAPAGRGRRLPALGAVVVALVAGAALVPVLRDSRSDERDRRAAPIAAGAQADRGRGLVSLRGVRVGVLNAGGRSGLGRAVAEVLQRRGASISNVSNAPGLERTRIAYRDRFEAEARAVARLLGARQIVPAASDDGLLAPGADVVVHLGRDRCLARARCEPPTPGVP